MSGERASSFVCISDNASWLNQISAAALADDAQLVAQVAWAQFDSAPMQHAHPQHWAYALIEGESKLLDIRLGRLCRSFPFGVLVQISADFPANDQQLFAHGFKKFSELDENLTHKRRDQNYLSNSERCYRFRLEEYKAVPDWLNARFWAHPDRFLL